MYTKIEEAAFFFSKMEENLADPDHVYYLSAFLSAARSVLQHMVDEHHTSWDDLEKKYNDDWDVVKFFRDKRNYSIHHGQVVPDRIEIVITEHITITDSFDVVDAAPSSTVDVQPSTSSVEKKTYFTDAAEYVLNHDGEVINLCRQYLRCLQSMLADIASGT